MKMNWDDVTPFYSNLLGLYSRLNYPPQYQEIATIDKHITYYLADHGDQFISARQQGGNYVVELDIKSAFPTICRNFFGMNSEFVKKMDSIEEKRGRLIYIATTLKEAGDYLTQLNIMCKVIVLGIVFELCDHEILVLELKKDGLLFTCNKETLDKLQMLLPIVGDNRLVNIDYDKAYQDYPFTKYLIDSNFRFHVDLYHTYYRSQKTSAYFQVGELTIKGKYKYMPKKIESLITDILNLKSINTKLLKSIYSTKYFKICQMNGLIELLEDYYICDNDCILDRNGNYIKHTNLSETEPIIYLRTFLYPAILATKM